MPILSDFQTIVINRRQRIWETIRGGTETRWTFPMGWLDYGMRGELESEGYVIDTFEYPDGRIDAEVSIPDSVMNEFDEMWGIAHPGSPRRTGYQGLRIEGDPGRMAQLDMEFERNRLQQELSAPQVPGAETLLSAHGPSVLGSLQSAFRSEMPRQQPEAPRSRIDRILGDD